MRTADALLAVASVAAQMLAASPAFAQASETQVKAEFLPRFARYVTWPASARPSGNAPVTLCVIGADPFGSVLNRAAAAQSIDGRRIAVRRLASAAEADGCQIAYVQGSSPQSTGQMLAALGSKPILTVTDARHGGPRGMVHFVVASGRVRFFIDEAGAARRNMAISSRLLALAVGVRQR